MKDIWKAVVGPKHMFDILGVHQLDVLIQLGLREDHTVLDVGSGLFRAGRFIMQYTPEYYAVEPIQAMIDTGIDNLNERIPRKILCTKKFDYRSFGIKFDYILCHALLTHFDKSDIGKFMRGVSRVIHDGSFVLATFHIDKDGSVGEKSWTRPLMAHAEEDIASIVKEYDMRCTFLGIAHPMGQRWALIRL